MTFEYMEYSLIPIHIVREGGLTFGHMLPK